MTLGNKIRALKADYVGAAVHISLDRAAALADEHEAVQLSNDERLEYQTALIWCSAAADFAPEGQAREGWLKLCKPLIDRQPTYQPQAAADALVAAAYEDAAQKATSFLVGDPANGVPLRNPMAHEIADAIRAMTPADARAALDRLIREAEARGMEMAATTIMDTARALPVQHESKERGQCTYNWARWAEGIILAAAGEAGK